MSITTGIDQGKGESHTAMAILRTTFATTPKTFAELVDEEVARARKKHPEPHRSPHESCSFLREEFEEFWDEVKSQDPSPFRMLTELIHVATVARRAAEDLGMVKTQ